MSEVVPELVIPGSYIEVRTEGLISVGGVSTGNIGIVGTEETAALRGITHVFSDYDSALKTLGAYSGGQFNLIRSIELLFQNGASTVYARGLEPNDAGQDKYEAAFRELFKDDVNILVAPELPTATALTLFSSLLDAAETNGKDMIAVVGSDIPVTDATRAASIIAQVVVNDRVIFVAPGIRAFDAGAKQEVDLSGTFSAAAIAGLLSTLPPHFSPTNKALSGATSLAQGARFSYGETVNLVKQGVLVLEQRQGVKVVRGITPENATNGPFRQITTRRITDQAKATIRLASNPFIGRLNNIRVRKALRGAIDGALTDMVTSEALVSYTLDVSATRQDEINGRAIVNVVLQPTFSIDFVRVTLVLE